MTMSDDQVVGRSGTVTTRIRGGDLPGEVQVAIRGGTESFIAYADQEIARGESILVFHSRGYRAVDVIACPAPDSTTEPL
jgi:membrane protein implicated in regulation of membrane protease activity